MLINHNQNMLCLDEFDILELRENADECDYLFVVSPKIETKICTKCGSCNVVNYGRYTAISTFVLMLTNICTFRVLQLLYIM